MKRIQDIRLAKTSQVVLVSTLLLSSLVLAGGSAHAVRSTAGASTGTATTTNASSTSGTGSNASQQQRLQNIISKGNQEIERRLTTLNTLTAKISAAGHLTASDKMVLTGEVGSTVNGLTNLRVQLDADTTVSSAHTDAESIYTEYRVYAIVAPKVALIKVADDQQVVQARLTTLAAKLQGRITTKQQGGKDVTTLQSELTDMNNQIANASKISSTIESTIIALQPSDYNSNHGVLNGDNTQLKIAHTDDQTALTDAKNIVAVL